MSRIVLDTNVLVSGLLNPYGAPGRVLDLILSGEVQIAFDDRILEEYAEVLLRPRFGFVPSHVRNLLVYFRQAGMPVSGLPLEELADQAADPDDLPFAEVAASGQVDALVTGNIKHFTFLQQTGLTVQTPAEFLVSWANERGEL